MKPNLQGQPDPSPRGLAFVGASAVTRSIVTDVTVRDVGVALHVASGIDML